MFRKKPREEPSSPVANLLIDLALQSRETIIGLRNCLAHETAEYDEFCKAIEKLTGKPFHKHLSEH